ncbi:MAG TPA: hypothetical protein VEN80_08650 [Thermoplasmata archaeon]|nr:hypothetical protein [Thermoplasmata archaeon]
MVRAPADWRRILRRAESLVRKRDRRALDLLLPALRWRYLKARNRAVVLLQQARDCWHGVHRFEPQQRDHRGPPHGHRRILQRPEETGDGA